MYQVMIYFCHVNLFIYEGTDSKEDLRQVRQKIVKTITGLK